MGALISSWRETALETASKVTIFFSELFLGLSGYSTETVLCQPIADCSRKMRHLTSTEPKSGKMKDFPVLHSATSLDAALDDLIRTFPALWCKDMRLLFSIASHI